MAEESSTSNLPQAFVDRLRLIVPAESFDACLASFALPKKTAFRVNTLLASVDEVLAELSAGGIRPTKIAWFDSAFWIEPEDRRRLLSSDAFQQARIYVQNPSSMLACRVLNPQPGETILDLAAAPGGKTTLIAAMMQNEGTISAVEPIRKRFYKLRDNLARCGATIVKTYMTDGRTVGNKTPERFDRVLLDAPCSGESRFRTDDPKSYEYWSDRKIREQSRKQVGLIKAAIRALKPGGVLVYCTCSFAPEENELAMEKALRRFAGIELQSIELPSSIRSHQLAAWKEEPLRQIGYRILPDDLFDAFFLCRMRTRQQGHHR